MPSGHGRGMSENQHDPGNHNVAPIEDAEMQTHEEELHHDSELNSPEPVVDETAHLLPTGHDAARLAQQQMRNAIV